MQHFLGSGIKPKAMKTLPFYSSNMVDESAAHLSQQEDDLAMEAGHLQIKTTEHRDDMSFFSQLSSDEQKTTAPSNQGNNSSAGVAEGIVRAEAVTIRNLRLVLICLVAAAAVSCSILIYKVSSNNEADAFQFSFDKVASQLTNSFKQILSENLNYAYLISMSLSSKVYVDSSFTPSFPNVSISQFENLTALIRTHGLVTDILWSPLIYSREERKGWEAYAMSKLANSSETSNDNSGGFPICNICGEGNEIANPAATMSFSGVGTVTCLKIEQGALGGYMTPGQCNYFAPMITPVCGCQPSTQSNTIIAATRSPMTSNAMSGIFQVLNGESVIDQTPPPYAPVWQISPALSTKQVAMFNQMSEPWRRLAITEMLERKSPVFSKAVDASREAIYSLSKVPSAGYFASIFYPVFESFDSQNVVGALVLDFPWINLFDVILPKSVGITIDGMQIVLENTCGQMFTYKVGGGSAQFQGEGDLHDSSFDSMVVETSNDDFNQLLFISSPQQTAPTTLSESSQCCYRFRIYPSNEFRSKFVTNKPILFTVIVAGAFGVTSFVFLLYDLIVRRLQSRVLDSAKRSEAIVSSLFPALVRDRLFRNNGNQPATSSSRRADTRTIGFDLPLINHKARLKTFLSHPPSFEVLGDSEPIADLFPNTTVLFADIAGFTAWSSEREPSQVFTLLESLYSEFDDIARELGVFKVETIGDCYVAVTGLPEKMKHHAVVMVEFAFRCLTRMHDLVSRLELVLGPGTADLTMRIGIHSGPVTAGVLRGERARFQLFGDTMNVASRMESTGKVNMVHISKETAHLLRESGKEPWLTRRQETVSVKGKGHMETYWARLLPVSNSNESAFDAHCDEGVGMSTWSQARSCSLDETDHGVWGGASLDNTIALKTSRLSGQDRLIEWNADLLQGLLQKIVAKRASTNQKTRTGKAVGDESHQDSQLVQFVQEITEVIDMPEFDERKASDPNLIDLGQKAQAQLRAYVAFIASLYNDNAFHNFEHACHVAMSASKLLKRIIAPDDVDYKIRCGRKMKNQRSLSREIHETTFGISSDPLMQFAVGFSALIHDVDHAGVTNKQLLEEDDPVAVKYQGKCVAEQRSIQVAWDTLMEDRFMDLRQCIYQTEEEKKRFRQLLVNAVIATDIADKELSTWRKHRWDKVFHQEPSVSDVETMSDRKATIVFEYIIQASDVAHTMQHWHIYQKWNKRLFNERYAAYLAGREPEDPSIGWHKGEIWFFDNYIIPLAKKLKECNVFGVSCDEYLTYALENRHEWELKGENIVSEMTMSHFREGINSNNTVNFSSYSIHDSDDKVIAKILSAASLTSVDNHQLR